MQTIASLADRLDMSPSEALEKLGYMGFEVASIEAEISDEQCDLLIDVDDDPSIAEKVREENIQRKERAKKAAQKGAAKRKAAAAKKKKAAAKKKKAPAKKKTAAAVKDTDATPEEVQAAEEEAKIEASPAAEILTGAEAAAVEKAIAESQSAEQDDEAATEEKGPSIVIGSAIEHEERHLEVVRADGTHVTVEEVEIDESAEAEESTDDDEEEGGLLAEAERRQEAEEQRKARQVSAPAVKPDPAVVAEVIRQANLKRAREKDRGEKPAETPGGSAPVKRQRKPRGPVPTATRKTGKTARKRQKKLEKMRAEETMRRDAAAAVKEYQAGGFEGGPKKRRKKRRGENGEDVGVDTAETLVIEVEDVMSVEELAEAMDYDTTDIILELMEQNVMATKNQSLSLDLIKALAEPKGFEVISVIPEEQDVLAEEPDDPATMEPRAPVVTVMGHVDHGKTSLLDRVREASVAAGESGGITQHIAAYEVELDQGRVVFLDTPGHEAFTAMRSRGAQATDVVVLVVAADDGIMPQTIEAIDHAKAAEVPIVVAINKCDKADAQPDRIRQELTRFDLTDEQWGGKTIMRNISAITGDGVKELMELLVLETELLELKANPNKRARGIIIESEITRGQGPVAWVLVSSGTLKVGDSFLAGESFGRVRSMQNAAGENVDGVGPSRAVVVTGFDQPPAAGDTFVAVEDERVARVIAAKRADRSKSRSGPAARHVTLEDFHAQLVAGEKQELNILIKADVQGSSDVLDSSISKLGNEEVQTRIVHTGVGHINESDILLASASDAVIIGFHVSMASPKVEKMAESEGVDVRTYKIIYEAIEDVRKALEGLLIPDEQEVVTGHAEIRAIFKASSLGTIAGCYMLDGEIRRDSLVRLKRGDKVVFEGKIGSLRRERDDVANVQSGYECGIKLEGYDKIEEGDIIEGYKLESVAKTLA